MQAAVVPAVSSLWQVKDVPQPQPGPNQVLRCPTWNSEALRVITILFLLRVYFTVRIHFPMQMSPQPSRSQRSNQTESATRPRRCAHGLLALQRLR